MIFTKEQKQRKAFVAAQYRDPVPLKTPLRYSRGLTKRFHTEYQSWGKARQRAQGKSLRLKDQKPYQDKGMHGLWQLPLTGFAAFLSYMGRKPDTGDQWSVDRIDNRQGYFPGNVRWATIQGQNWNKTNHVLVTLDGETYPLAAWCYIFDLDYSTIHKRVQKGMAPEQAVHAGPGSKESA